MRRKNKFDAKKFLHDKYIKGDYAVIPIKVDSIDDFYDRFDSSKNTLAADLSEYIDKCLRASLREIRIIHGYGEGILRKMVQKHLKSRKEIESYRDGQYNEGGKGVTVAYLK